jgi:hypothetical protein
VSTQEGDIVTAKTWLRAGLWLLAVLAGAVGVMQLLAPQAFYEKFPTSTHTWVAYLPPYNEHLMRDVGGLNLALLIVVVVAAVTLDRLMVRTALTAVLFFAVVHFVFHVTHLEDFPRGDAIVQTASLGVTVLLPALLLWLSFRVAWPGGEHPGIRR